VLDENFESYQIFTKYMYLPIATGERKMLVDRPMCPNSGDKGPHVGQLI